MNRFTWLGWTVLALAAAPAAFGADSNSIPYTWRNVAIGGGGFVTGIVPHPAADGLVYCRTDVGGAYRWDSAASRWVPMTDYLGARDVNLTGIESLAVDPADTNRVYLAAGTYSPNPGAFLRSDDQGRTFQRTDVPFTMGANEAGRFNGERLAVDPNLGTILLFGSRRDGLWRSDDRSVTWKKVESFPATIENPAGDTNNRPRFGRPQPVGIICVLFDPASGKPGKATPVIYAAASVPGTNLFRSTDAGATWQPVPNQPVGLRPNHVVRASDGLLYISYGKESGPNNMSDGAIWKFNAQSGAWTDVTPVKPAGADQTFGYGCVAVDAQNPGVLMATTFCHWKPHDEIFRSTNAGASWFPVWTANTQWDYSSAPYTKTRTPHWMGTIVIDPFRSGHVLFTTGYGIWGSTDVNNADAGQATHWFFPDDGLEETVPLALVSPSAGPALISGVGDVDGFRHDDLDHSPPQGSFAGPRYGNTEDLAVPGKRPAMILRTGTGNNRFVKAAVSDDGGMNWTTLASEPPGSAGAGTITASADGETIVWTPRRSSPHVTTDRGSKWAACEGLKPGCRVVADTVNPVLFYAYDSQAGRFLVSTDSAAGFIETPAAFAGGAGQGGGPQLAATPGIEGDAWLCLPGRGLFHSSDRGASFSKLRMVNSAHSIGFGKPGPRKSYPTLYVAGRIGPVEGLFRSDDSGATWQRITDDLHQFGSISRVTGDPRTFGRVYFATGGRGVIRGDPEP
ncbi:MAG: cellulase [Verrucomicrobiota bacterium]